MKRSTIILIVLSLPLLLVGLIPPSSGRARESAASAQLIAHWQLEEDETGSAAVDSSGNGHDGVVSGGYWVNTVPVAGDNEYSFAFTGTTYSYMEAPAFDINDDFTVMAWVNPSEFTNRAFVGKHTAEGGNQLLFGFYQGGYYLGLQDDSYAAGDPMTGWQQLILTGDANQIGTLVTLYRNGQPLWQHQFKSVAGDMSGGKGWTLGRDWDGQVTNDFFEGLMADVRIYDAALSEGEIAALTAPRLVSHWRLGEGSGTSAGDSSGGGHDGTIINGTWSTDVPPGTGLGHSLRLDGDGYVETALFDLDDSFTIAAWTKAEAFDSNAILAKHTDTGANQLVYGYYGAGFHARLHGEFTDAGVPRTGWDHLTLVGLPNGEGTELTLYRNGVSQWSRTVAARLGKLGSGRPWIIGMDWDGDTATDHFVGNLADIRIYDRALTRQQVADLALAFAAECGVPSGGYPTVESGVGDPQCDVVTVGAGEFPTTDMAPEHGLILRGAGAEQTTLTGGDGDGPLLLLENNMEIEDLAVNGVARAGVSGPVMQVGAQSVTSLSGTAFKNNVGLNGGVIWSLGRVMIRSSLFEGNRATSRAGAIYNYGAGAPGPTELHVQDTVFSGNTAKTGGVLYSDAALDTFIRSDFLNNVSDAGGALYAYFNTLEVQESSFESNWSQGDGGALSIDYGDVTIGGSRFQGNSAQSDGGAIYMSGDSARLALRGTVFTGNVARESGGAVDADGGSLSIATSTFSANQAGDLATASAPASVLSLDDAGALVENSTFSDNQTLAGPIPLRAAIIMIGDSASSLVHSTVADNDLGGEAGTLGLLAGGTALHVRNTILAGNGAQNCRMQLAPDETSFEGTLVDDGSCQDATVSSELHLQPLADNGGWTQTRAITDDSAANGTADPNFCLWTDQRAVARDQAACDVGAFEYVSYVEAGPAIYMPVVIR